MRRILFILAGVMLLTCCSTEVRRVMGDAERLLDSCPEQAVAMLDSIRPEAMRQGIGGRSRYVLLQQLARHKAWMPLDVDTLLMEAVIWTNNHGTPNERLLANYLLGYGYSEQGFTTEAQHAYQQAIESADTTRSDCDFSRLAKAYAQKSALYLNRTHPDLMLEDARKAKHYALKANDRILILSCNSQIGLALDAAGKKEEALATYKESYRGMLETGDSVWASYTARLIAQEYVDMKELDSAAYYIRYYEKYNSLKSQDDLSAKNTGYYPLKGTFHEAKGNLDSAFYYYYKELSLNKSSQKTGACTHLKELYCKLGKPDSAFFYSEKYSRIKAESDSISKAAQLQNLHVRYNYDSLAVKLREKEATNTMLANVALILALVIAVGGIVRVNYDKGRISLRLRRRTLQLEYQLLKEKGQDTAATEKDIAAVNKKLSGKELWEMTMERVRFTEEYNYLQLCLKEKKNVRPFMESIANVVDRYFPLQSVLISSKITSETDRMVCFLTLLGFRPTDCTIVLSSSTSAVSNSRDRLSKTLFGPNCPTRSFSKRIREYTGEQDS